jgi:hypothetical protein
MGLLDGVLGNGFDDPRSQMVLGLAQGLLSARGGAGLSAGLGNVQAVQQNQIKNRLLNAQIGEIGVKNQMEQYQLQRLQNWSNLGGNSQGSAQPATQPNASTISTNQSMGDVPMFSSGITSTPAQPTQPTQAAQQPQSGGFPFPLPGKTEAQSRQLASMLGPDAYMSKYIEQTAPQTDITKLMAAQGIDPSSPIGKMLLQQATVKANYTAPANIRPGGYTQDVNGNVQQFPHIPDGFQAIKGQDGNLHVVPVDGGLSAILASATAQAGGKASVTPSVAYNGNAPVFSTQMQDVGRAQGSAPVAPGYANEPQMKATMQGGMGADPAALTREISAVSKSILNPTLDPASRKMLQNNLADLKNQQAQIGAPGTTQQGALSPVPQLGAVSNANASQQASADTMHASYAKLQAGNSTANSALDALNKMQGLAANKNAYLTAGPLGTMQTPVNADAAEYEKQRANVIALLSAQNGTNGTDAGRALTGESVPDFGKPKAAIKDGLGTLANQTTQAQLKTNFLTPIYQSGDSKNYTTKENEFDQNISPSMIPLLTMPAGPNRAMLLKNAAQNPAMKAKLTWAAEQGLLK